MNVQGKEVLVIGLGSSGQAAARLLAGRGARVTCVDENKNEDLMKARGRLKKDGIDVLLGCKKLPGKRRFDLAVLSPGVDPARPLVMEVAESGVPVIGPLPYEPLLPASWEQGLAATAGSAAISDLADLVTGTATRTHAPRQSRRSRAKSKR